MKALFVSLFAFVLLFNLHSQVDRVDPPHWWTGMHHPELQLMISGKNIGGASVKFDYEGVRMKAVSSLENPNYLFIDLEILPQAQPGTFLIDLVKGGETIANFDFELKKRDPGSSSREGFNHSDVIYLLMPDRFANGDPGNDVVKVMRETVADRENRTGRHGGDLKGITEHLDYIEKMGYSALWLNPVLENDMERSSYHGYSITDFYRVDPRLGSNEDFEELSRMAAEKGIKMIMDMVFNHIGLFHPWMGDVPAGDWINYYPDYVRTNHRRTVNQDPYASEYDRRLMVDGWFVPTMPDLNLHNRYLANYLIQNSIWWIEYAHLAGIRMDTYPYPAKEAMAEWNRRILDEYPHFNIVGEEWSTDPSLVSYWQRGRVNSDGYQGNLPSLFDFPLQAALRESLLAEDGWDSGWLKLYETLSSDYQYPDPYNLVIFPDNHDMSRFYMQMGMDVDLYKLGIIYILTMRGIPQFLYGSEILMTHQGSDHHGDIRKDFPGGWTADPVNAFTGEGLAAEEAAMQDFFRKLLIWRSQNPVIHSGKLIHFAPSQGIYVYGRYNADKTVMVILNKSEEQGKVDPIQFNELVLHHTGGTDVITGKHIDLTAPVLIPAKTGYILELN
jgi:glycosidase